MIRLGWNLTLVIANHVDFRQQFSQPYNVFCVFCNSKSIGKWAGISTSTASLPVSFVGRRRIFFWSLPPVKSRKPPVKSQKKKSGGVKSTFPYIDLLPYRVAIIWLELPLHLWSAYLFRQFHGQIIQQNLVVV